MAPLIATSDLTVTTALRQQITKSCTKHLSKAFIAWLLEDFNNLLLIAAAAAKRAGAGQDFLDIAILGFAAHAGVLSEPGLAELKKGLTRLAGLRPIVNGVRMPLYTDAVGMLGVALGTAVIADAELTAQVAGWTRRFLKSAYEMDGVQDWQRCLLAAADLSLRSPLKLPFPKSGFVADVRLALLAKGLINSPNKQVRLDAARVRQSTIEERLSGPVDCERAALCVAGVEWVIRQAGKQGDPAGASTEHPDTNPPHTLEDDQQGESGEMAHGPEERKKGHKRKPVRRDPRYEKIEKALGEIAAARPKNHEEVFALLNARGIPLPHAAPFVAAKGWLAGFQKDDHTARVWLSKAWARLDLPSFPRGPK